MPFIWSLVTIWDLSSLKSIAIQYIVTDPNVNFVNFADPKFSKMLMLVNIIKFYLDFHEKYIEMYYLSKTL